MSASSRIVQRFNVPRGYASVFARCGLLDGHFDIHGASTVVQYYQPSSSRVPTGFPEPASIWSEPGCLNRPAAALPLQLWYDTHAPDLEETVHFGFLLFPSKT